MLQPAILALEDGTVFEGESIGAPGLSVGEVVFNTAMTGYQEILTDPSYARQLVTLTYPHIGNTGATAQDDEARQVWAAGLIVRDVPRRPSSWRNEAPLPEWMAARGVVGIAGIDTRKLTRLLRDRGAQSGAVMAGDDLDVEAALEAARKFPGLKGMDLAQEVSTREAYAWRDGQLDLDSNAFARTPARYRVVAYDYGVKHNILRMLAERGCDVTVVPARTPVEEVLAMQPDGVFLSNGPGDPAAVTYAVDSIGGLLGEVPIFGICLGHQLLATALGGTTEKLKFGHHGGNHPVRRVRDNAVEITSQNHNYAVVPGLDAEITHQNLNDGVVEGLRRRDLRAFSVQYHPEASPGPTDSHHLFHRFVDLIQKTKTGAKA